MKKLNLEPVVNFAKDVGKVVGYGLLMALPYAVNSVVTREVDNRPVGYSDAVKAITQSSMLGSQQHEALAAMRKDGDGDYYKSIIHIVKGSALGSTMVEMIQELSK